MQNRNLPAVYKPRGWAPFKLSYETKRTLAAIAALFRYLYRLNPHGFMLTTLVGVFAITVIGVMIGAATPPTEANRASIMIVPIPERAPSVPFPGNNSTFEGEEVGTELTPESFPPPKEEAHPTTQNRKGDELSPQQYIDRYSGIAVKQMKKYGIPASITLAQGIIESRSGNSTLAKVANNHFGIKCFAKRHKACCVKSYDDSNADSFVIFGSPEAAFKAHSQFLQKDRYKRLKKYGRNYAQWAYGLKACGYATDKTYGPKLISIIKRHNLARFDK